jgi:hypothetical protein
MFWSGYRRSPTVGLKNYCHIAGNQRSLSNRYSSIKMTWPDAYWQKLNPAY